MIVHAIGELSVVFSITSFSPTTYLVDSRIMKETAMDDVSPSSLEKAKETVAFLLHLLAEDIQPRVALVCGSGLSGLADALYPSPRVEVDYAEIPHFPTSTGIAPRHIV